MAHQTNLRAVLLDRLMSRFIPGGGLFIVACVCAILAFLAIEVLPLLRSASANPAIARDAAGACFAVDFVDGSEEPVWVTREGVFVMARDEKEPRRLAVPGYERIPVVGSASASVNRVLGIFYSGGGFALVRVERDREKGIKLGVMETLELAPLEPDAVAVARDESGHPRIARLKAGRVSFAGPGGLGDVMESDVPVEGARAIALASSGFVLAVALPGGEIEVWNTEDASDLKRTGTLPSRTAPATALAFLIGDESIVVADERGGVEGYFRVRHVKVTNTGTREEKIAGHRIPAGGSAVLADHDLAKTIPKGSPLKLEPGGMPWIHTRTFPALPAPGRAIAASSRNKGFLIGDALGGLSLYHATTQNRGLEIAPAAKAPVSAVAFNGRDDALASWCGGVRTWSLWNPHPESSFRALAGSVWYESYPEPEVVWQSSSGTQDSEPKLGLWPLVFGTLKGTFFALLFSVPVALSAAVYVARFAHPRLKAWVKPSVEVMAGIPSVVVGMVAALWLAPVFERHLFALFLAAFFFPAVFTATVWGAGRLPRGEAGSPRRGVEMLGASLSLLLAAGLALLLAESLEGSFFKGDFRQWLFDSFGIRYDLRNGFIVGIALGFAVIPLVFSIAEDAISGVPASLTNAAMALGATRWQTVRHVILPAAASGIFAAIVLGLGRAAGETMIVVMAAGNTPIMDPSPWNGMRTMSAAMAIEMPEAPHNGTLYRVLFLAGLLLFAFTSVLNTVAEVVGSRLRRKYGRY